MDSNMKQYEGFRRLYERLLALHGVEGAETIFWLLSDELGGERVTVPSLEVLYREARNVRIVKDYDSGQYSYSQLAVKHDLDIRQIARVLKKEPLFGKESADESI